MAQLVMNDKGAMKPSSAHLPLVPRHYSQDPWILFLSAPYSSIDIEAHIATFIRLLARNSTAP